MAAEACPLCRAVAVRPYHRDPQRDYHQCRHCALVFVPAQWLLTAAAEKAQYDLHRNAIDDPGYRAFLARAAAPLQQRLPAPAAGLDFGCGPGPALADMLREQGYRMALYDPFYYPDDSVLAAQYDFVTCTEVIEHVYDAAAVWQQLFALLRPGGTLVVMTKRVSGREAFARWHYKTDPTHVRFYSDATLEWIASQFNASLTLAGADVALYGTR